MTINLSKTRKRLKKSKAGRRLCKAYAELVAEYEHMHIRAMNAEAKLECVRRAIEDEEED